MAKRPKENTSGEEAAEPKGESTSIRLNAEAMKAIDDYCDKRGARGVKVFVLSKLVLWFANQPEAAKSAVVGWIDRGMEADYAAALRKLADDLDGNVSIPVSAETARLLTNAAIEAGGKTLDVYLKDQAGTQATLESQQARGTRKVPGKPQLA